MDSVILALAIPQAELFEKYYEEIYSPELELKKESSKASFLDPDIAIKT